jgi:hypothetical protein
MSISELPDPINHFIEVINQGDTESFLDFFTSDGIVDDWLIDIKTRLLHTYDLFKRKQLNPLYHKGYNNNATSLFFMLIN